MPEHEEDQYFNEYYAKHMYDTRILCPKCKSNKVMGNKVHGFCMDCSLLWETREEYMLYGGE